MMMFHSVTRLALSARKKHHHAWIILIAACCIHLGTFGILLNTLGVFTVPICEELGIGRGAFSMHNTIRSLVACIALPFTAWAYRRVDIRVLTTICGVVSVFSVGCMAFYRSVWQWNLSGLLLGIVGVICVNTLCQTITGNWFTKKAGLAVGIAAAFSGVGGTFFTPIVAKVLEIVGWRATYLILAGFCSLLIFPFSLFVIRYRPQDIGLLPYGAREEAPAQETPRDAQTQPGERLRRLPLILMGLCCGLVSMSSSFYQHAPSYTVSIGYSAMVGAALNSALFFGNIIGKLGYGHLVDRCGVKRIGTWPVVTSVLGLTAILAVGARNTQLLMTGAFFFGTVFCFGNIVISILVRNLYGPERFTTVYPFVMMVSTPIGASGSVTLGYLYDHFGSYVPALMFCVAMYLLAIALFRAVGRMRKWAD